MSNEDEIDDPFQAAMEAAETPREAALTLGMKLVSGLMESSNKLNRSNEEWTLTQKLQAEKACEIAATQLDRALLHVAPASKAAALIRGAIYTLDHREDIDVSERLKKFGF